MTVLITLSFFKYSIQFQVYFYSAFHDTNHCKVALQKIKDSTIYTDQNYKRNTFVFALIFHELNSKI